ncbi:energy transducer TonB [Sandarakinorhabdus sp.]|uniref:energy transducer TonB n=1 Tax=Sandarakinorhabdus sp. TaxID=1916663 RepID=UPI00286E95E7|nr:energy transducer TonB [Sandarakinorhabdus sp.]
MTKNRQIALGGVVVLHILLGYAIISGFAISVVKKIVEPLEAVNVKEEAPPPDEPPPPPPKEIEIPPYVPPPEVSVASDAPTNSITTQSTISRPDPPVVSAPAPPAPPAPPAVAPQPATPKGRGNAFSDDDYPSASRAAEEEGVTRVSYVVGTDGRVSQCEVVQGSGFKRLDDATCSIIMRRFRFNPATRDGQAVPERKTQPVRWRLTN